MTAREIVAFHRDADGDWVAELACGHNQHVRHDPPWTNRPWAMSRDGRDAARGRTLNCVKCERGEPPDVQPGRDGKTPGDGASRC